MLPNIQSAAICAFVQSGALYGTSTERKLERPTA